MSNQRCYTTSNFISTTINYHNVHCNIHSGGARILEQVGPEAGPKVLWQGLKLFEPIKNFGKSSRGRSQGQPKFISTHI